MPDVLRSYEIDLQLRGLRPQTRSKYLANVRAFRDAFPTPLHRRTRHEIRAWLLHLVEERRLAPSTYTVHLAALRFLYTHTIPRPRLIGSVPRPLRRPPTLRPALCTDDLLRLFAAAHHPTARLLFQAAYATGMRLGELCRLRLADVDPSTGLITVPDGKGGYPRVVVSGRTLLRALESTADPVFPVAPRTASRWFRRAATHASLHPALRFHDLRHAFATDLCRTGTDVFTLGAVLGHRTLQSTARYVRPDRRRISAVRSPLDRIARA